MNKKIVFFLIMLLVLGVALQARPERKSWPNRMPRLMLNSLRFGLHMAESNLLEPRIILHFKAEIGLTPAQEKKIENMMLASEEAAIRRGSDIKVLELKFAALLKGNRIDRREMEKMARDMGKLKTDLQVDRLNYLLDVRDTLTPEQVQKIEKFRKNIPEHLRERMRDRRGSTNHPDTQRPDQICLSPWDDFPQPNEKEENPPPAENL